MTAIRFEVTPFQAKLSKIKDHEYLIMCHFCGTLGYISSFIKLDTLANCVNYWSCILLFSKVSAEGSICVRNTSVAYHKRDPITNFSLMEQYSGFV